MTQSDNYPLLFSDIKISNVRLKNRLIHAAITTGFSQSGIISDKLINYYSSRAIGGCGAVILEPSNIHSGHTDSRRPDVYGGHNQDGLKRLAESVESHDCRLFAQIQDSGRGVRELGRNDSAIGASALPDDLSWTVPRAMSYDEIQLFIAEVTESSALLNDAGFSGVELSAGHGHLFHQFMSPWSNHREDEYGGDISGRTRLVRELIQAIRSKTGSNFVIGLKLPSNDGVENSIDIDEANLLATELADTGQVDYWTFCRGSHANSLVDHLPDAHGNRTPYLSDIITLRQNDPEIPTAALGYITDPNEAERVLEDGTAELVMLGRPLITDPAWGNKARLGREADIRYCVSCNTCWKAVINDGSLECDNNPRVAKANEADWAPDKVAKPKNIVVVGSGVAGMEAAWVAAAKGHNVIVIGSGNDVGGKTRLHAELPGGENLSSIYDYQLLSANKHNIHFKLGTIANVELIKSYAPDSVILATGSTMTWPDFLPHEYRDEGFFLDVRELVSQFIERRQKQPGRVVIFDKDHTEMTYAVAEFLNDIFDEVVLITPRERIASDVSLTNRQGIYRRLYEQSIKIITSSTVSPDSKFEEAEVEIVNIFNSEKILITDVAVFTYATPRTPNDELLIPLQEIGYDVSLIGDSFAPRSVLCATREGHTLGNDLT